MEDSIPATPFTKELSGFDPHSILNSFPDSILLMDSQGQVIFVNHKFTDFTGYAPSEIIGLSHCEAIRILLAKEDLTYPMLKNDFDQVIEGKPFSARRKFYHRMGYTIPVDLYETQILNNQGEPAGALLLIKDRHSELMVTITNLINSSLDITHVLHNVTRVVVEYLELSSTAIFFLDSSENVLRLASCNAFADEDLAKVVIPLGELAPGIIAQTRQPLYVPNLREDSLIHEAARPIHKAKSSIGFPLICRDTLLGVIAFDAETVREFSDWEFHLFENIAGQVALAIYNAHLFSKLEHLSITDGLTEAYNHRYFQVKLAESLQIAQKDSTPLSLLFLDLDHFKNYNDTFGHPKGDELLQEFTQILRSTLRDSDSICRYGGEEFSIILQDCPLTQAKQIAERIRVACESHPFFGIEKLPGERITVSIGIAGFPTTTTPQELISKADQALYLAKRFRNHIDIIE